MKDIISLLESNNANYLEFKNKRNSVSATFDVVKNDMLSKLNEAKLERDRKVEDINRELTAATDKLYSEHDEMLCNIALRNKKMSILDCKNLDTEEKDVNIKYAERKEVLAEQYQTHKSSIEDMSKRRLEILERKYNSDIAAVSNNARKSANAYKTSIHSRICYTEQLLEKSRADIESNLRYMREEILNLDEESNFASDDNILIEEVKNYYILSQNIEELKEELSRESERPLVDIEETKKKIKDAYVNEKREIERDLSTRLSDLEESHNEVMAHLERYKDTLLSIITRKREIENKHKKHMDEEIHDANEDYERACSRLKNNAQRKIKVIDNDFEYESKNINDELASLTTMFANKIHDIDDSIHAIVSGIRIALDNAILSSLTGLSIEDIRQYIEREKSELLDLFTAVEQA